MGLSPDNWAVFRRRSRRTGSKEEDDEGEEVVDDVEKEVGCLHRTSRKVAVPWLLSDDDQSHVALDEDEREEREEDGGGRVAGDDTVALLMVQTEEPCGERPGEDAAREDKEVDTGDGTAVAEDLDKENGDAEDGEYGVQKHLGIDEMSIPAESIGIRHILPVCSRTRRVWLEVSRWMTSWWEEPAGDRRQGG